MTTPSTPITPSTPTPDAGAGPAHPRPLAIDAGLTTIPRQIATFGEFRHAMLSALPTHPALRDWRARGEGDLGVMLVEMWAYACAVVAFYDETIAHESYLRTARLSPSVRKLVGLLGYRPRPAVAARARLAVRVSGRRPVVLPAGLALRSAAFDGQPPQVFEVEETATAYPVLNGWPLEPTRPAAIPAGTSRLLLAARDARVTVDDRLLVTSAGAPVGGVFTAKAVERITEDGTAYVAVTLDHPLPTAVPFVTARLLRPTASTALWANTTDPQPLVNNGWVLALAGVVPRIQANDVFIARVGAAGAVLRVWAVTQGTKKVVAGTTIPGTSTKTPDVRAPLTILLTTSGWPASVLGTSPDAVTIEYGMRDAGTLTAIPDRRIAPGAPLVLRGPVETPSDGTEPALFLVEDADGAATELRGLISVNTRVLTPSQGSGLTTPLMPPATVFGNIMTVTRGETVPSELLGTGDASAAHQTFTLRNAPLTYLSVPTTLDPNGVRAALTVWVRDIRWSEVPSFFGVGPDERVYIVRQDDAGASSVTFGDGVRGARLPSGAAVVARYRFGAGAASPPAGAITQLATPVAGVTAVRDPMGAAGGDDTQPAAGVRAHAPRSALLFGRAVSILDMRALAASQPGVTDAQAQWAWDAGMRQPIVRIWFIGPPSIASAITASLRAAVAAATPIEANTAQAVPASLVVDLRVDRRYQLPLVRRAVADALTAPATGLLSPERIGIGTPLFRSVLMAEILAVPGVTAVAGLVWRGAPFDAYGHAPGDGAWFRVGLTVTATEDQNG